MILSFLILNLSIQALNNKGGILKLPRILEDIGTTSYFTDAKRLTLNEIFNYNLARKKGLNPHSITKPPGCLLFFKIFLLLSKKIFDFISLSFLIPEKLRIYLPALQNYEIFSLILLSFIIMILPSFLISFQKRFYKKNNIFLNFLWLSTPSLFLFVPSVDSIYPLFSFLSVVLFNQGLFENNKKHLIVSGFISALFIYFTYIGLTVVLINFFQFLFFLYKHKMKNFSRILPYFFAILSFFAFIYLLSDFNVIQDFFIAKLANNKCKASQRSHLIYLFYNLHELFFFSGILSSYFFIKGILFTNLNLRKLDKQGVISFSLFFSILLVIFMGIIKGEVDRVFIFLMPLLQLSSLKELKKSFEGKKEWFFILLLVQLLQIIILKEFSLYLYISANP